MKKITYLFSCFSSLLFVIIVVFMNKNQSQGVTLVYEKSALRTPWFLGPLQPHPFLALTTTQVMELSPCLKIKHRRPPSFLVKAHSKLQTQLFQTIHIQYTTFFQFCVGVCFHMLHHQCLQNPCNTMSNSFYFHACNEFTFTH